MEAKKLIKNLGERKAQDGAVWNARRNEEEQAGKHEYSVSQFQALYASLDIAPPGNSGAPRDALKKIVLIQH
jgi:hypothetical protein